MDFSKLIKNAFTKNAPQKQTKEEIIAEFLQSETYANLVQKEIDNLKNEWFENYKSTQSEIIDKKFEEPKIENQSELEKFNSQNLEIEEPPYMQIKGVKN